MRRLSLQALTLVFVAVFVTVTIGTGLAIFTATHRTIARLVDARIIAAADSVAVARTPMTTAELLRRMAALDRNRDTGDIGVLLVDRAGRRLGGNIALRRPLPTGLSKLGPDAGIEGLTAGRGYARAVGDGRVLTLIAETEPFDDYPTARIRIYFIGFGAILLVVLVGIIVFARLVGRRIGDMRTTVDAIIDGDMRHRVPVNAAANQRGGDPFDLQAQAFNRMLDRIAELMRGLADVSGNIAHDLRSPLARLRGQLTALERHAENPHLRDGLAAAIAQTDAVLGTFTAILRIAEIEGGQRRAGFTDLDLTGLVRDIAAMMVPVAEDGGHVLTASTPTPLPIHGDRQLLTQAIINLIDNAQRHTPAGTHIHVETASDHGLARIIVRDNGPGIAATDRARAMTRFGRLDDSRARPGNGLGLPLVAAIVQLHRGDIVLDDAAPGLCVILTLPLLPATAS